jgi:murein DD-endopeptidase MepM/ murein hydrolase activator NlpD
MHSGLDLAAPTGTPIRAAANGVVEEVGPNGGYGNYVRIRHAADLSTAYGHMSRFAEDVQTGTQIRQGEVIGYVGSTGMSTGPHLHYEVHRAGEPVDPMPYLPAAAARILIAQGEATAPNVARGSAD